MVEATTMQSPLNSAPRTGNISKLLRKQSSFNLVLDSACKAASKLDRFLASAEDENNGYATDDDYHSITSELLHLKEREEALRRELEGIELEPVEETSRSSSPASQYDEDKPPAQSGFLKLRSFDDDYQETMSFGTLGFDTPPKVLKRVLPESAAPSMLPLSPFSSSLDTIISDDSSSIEEHFRTKPLMIPRQNIVSEDDDALSVQSNRSLSAYGLRHQITQKDFEELQMDLETTMNNLRNLEISCSIDKETKADNQDIFREKRRQHDTNNYEMKQKYSVVWKFVVGLAELLYGESEDSIEAAVESRLVAMRQEA